MRILGHAWWTAAAGGPSQAHQRCGGVPGPWSIPLPVCCASREVWRRTQRSATPNQWRQLLGCSGQDMICKHFCTHLISHHTPSAVTSRYGQQSSQFWISLGMSGSLRADESYLKRIRVENLTETGFDHSSDDTGHAVPVDDSKDPATPFCYLASILSQLHCLAGWFSRMHLIFSTLSLAASNDPKRCGEDAGGEQFLV